MNTNAETIERLRKQAEAEPAPQPIAPAPDDNPYRLIARAWVAWVVIVLAFIGAVAAFIR